MAAVSAPLRLVSAKYSCRLAHAVVGISTEPLASSQNQSVQQTNLK
jgi:hypothetical protein